jgi:hypothetical protein
MSESTRLLQLSDVLVKRGEGKNQRWEGGGRSHIPVKIGYNTPLSESEIVTYQPTERIAPGVEFSVWSGKEDREDGALITIKAPDSVVTTNEEDEEIKCATPVQQIKTGVTTREIPYTGDSGIVFGLFVVNNETFVYKFSNKTISPQPMIKLSGGDTMCWIASRNSTSEVKINEHTIPKWTENTFRTIKEGSDDDKLPGIFWETYHQLLNGNEKSKLIVEVEAKAI